MAYSESNPAGDITLDAGFRAWALAIRNAITASGIVRTSDTGQIDLTTVASPAVSNYAGYDIFRFDDAAQASDPIFFKLEYGKGTAATRHALRCTVGTGSDGAGGITNASTAQAALSVTTASGNGVVAASFFDGEFVLLDAATGVVGAQIPLHILRHRDVNGNLISGQFSFYLIANGGFVGQVRSAGAWGSTDAPIIVEASLAAGGAMVMGYFLYTSWPIGTPRGLIMSANSITNGESGSIDVNGVAAGFKKPSGAGPVKATGNAHLLVRTS